MIDESRLPVVNPIDPAAYGRRNLIRAGRARQWGVRDFPGPLSIKGVVRGEARWTTPAGRHVVRPDTLLVLPAGQTYTIEIDTPYESETFCAFFRDGFVERARHGRCERDETLLDDPTAVDGADFHERLLPAADRLGAAMRGLAGIVRDRDPVALDWAFETLAGVLAGARDDHRRAVDRLGAQRAPTRAEIHRRLWRAREAMEGDLAAPWTLEAMAGFAGMSPHHFLRCFAACFRETPRAWLARRRLERAATLLGSGRFSVTDACLEVGYVSLGSFSTAFRRRFGRPPSDLLPSG